MTPIKIEELLTWIENDPGADALFPYNPGGLASNLYIELLDSWDLIPDKTRAVMAFVGASLKRQHYRELQAEIEVKQITDRLTKGRG